MDRTENLFLVNAFTKFDSPNFSGNPAIVCFIEFDDNFSDQKKQKIATEFNQPATAFVSKGWSKLNPKTDLNSYTIRWFSPTTELPLCGHGTFATSVVIFKNSKDENIKLLNLESKLGHQLVSILDLETGMITVTLPANPPRSLNTDNDSIINELIQVTVGSKELLCDVQFPDKTGIVIFVLRNPFGECPEKFIRSFKPEYDKMLKIVPEDSKIRGIGITVRGISSVNISSKVPNMAIEFYSRVFMPFQGINEDSVCGSLHTVIVPYWDSKFREEGLISSNEFTRVRQASERSGDLFVKYENEQVFMKGYGLIVFKGIFNVN